MRVRKKTIWAKIDGRGRLDFYKGELEEFCRLHPNRNAVIRVEIQPIEPSERTKGYYYGYVVPSVRRGLYEMGEMMSESDADEFLRKQCPITLSQEMRDGEWRTTIREFNELDSAEANEYIEWVKEFASENLYVVIDDPNV